MRIKMNAKETAVVKAVEAHNDYCYKVGNMMMDARCGEPRALNMECVEAMRQGNIEAGIRWCCEMRALRIDAVVDMIWGYVYPREEIYDDDQKMENGESRYLAFEYVEERMREV